MQVPALRSAEAAQSAADGAASATTLSNLQGVLQVPGAPEVGVASVIEVSDAPVDALNGSALVYRVHHEYSKRSGFVSTIWFNKLDGGVGGAL